MNFSFGPLSNRVKEIPLYIYTRNRGAKMQRATPLFKNTQCQHASTRGEVRMNYTSLYLLAVRKYSYCIKYNKSAIGDLQGNKHLVYNYMLPAHIIYNAYNKECVGLQQKGSVLNIIPPPPPRQSGWNKAALTVTDKRIPTERDETSPKVIQVDFQQVQAPLTD